MSVCVCCRIRKHAHNKTIRWVKYFKMNNNDNNAQYKNMNRRKKKKPLLKTTQLGSLSRGVALPVTPSHRICDWLRIGGRPKTYRSHLTVWTSLTKIAVYKGSSYARHSDCNPPKHIQSLKPRYHVHLILRTRKDFQWIKGQSNGSLTLERKGVLILKQRARCPTTAF